MGDMTGQKRSWDSELVTVSDLGRTLGEAPVLGLCSIFIIKLHVLYRLFQLQVTDVCSD